MAKASTSKRISARLTPRLEQGLRRRSLMTGKSESDIIREALEAHFAAKPETTALALAERLGLVGAAKGLPKDLSTNRKHFEGLGEAQGKRK